uniref:Uncharacterized protein n=1 Tax=Oryza sativa subsp. japonica TaxID=39947 RepID=Q10R67_ORYSJ|nr:hypothetical protein LOC_Os03g07390 [Oryza sativa Japonica Group]
MAIGSHAPLPKTAIASLLACCIARRKSDIKMLFKAQVQPSPLRAGNVRSNRITFTFLQVPSSFPRPHSRRPAVRWSTLYADEPAAEGTALNVLIVMHPRRTCSWSHIVIPVALETDVHHGDDSKDRVGSTTVKCDPCIPPLLLSFPQDQ